MSRKAFRNRAHCRSLGQASRVDQRVDVMTIADVPFVSFNRPILPHTFDIALGTLGFFRFVWLMLAVGEGIEVIFGMPSLYA